MKSDKNSLGGVKGVVVGMMLVAAGCVTGDAIRTSFAKTYDLAVIEATPGGIAMAVRAAREGLSVLLVNRTQHIGGMLSNGVNAWDTSYEGKRAPIYDEVRRVICEYYRTTYGPDSDAYRAALPRPAHFANGHFEPHVAERILDTLVAREPRITLLKGYVPVLAERDGALLRSITIREFEGTKLLRVKARAFADCSYEADLVMLAEVPYRVGREARGEYDEPHAGKLFMRKTDQRPASISDEEERAFKRLNLRKFPGYQERIDDVSTGVGDRCVQAANWRPTLSFDPANRRPVEKPAGYDRNVITNLVLGCFSQPESPNKKIFFNRPQLVGPHQGYVEGNWAVRQRVMDQLWTISLSALWFLQNDESVSVDARANWREFGLAKDEFSDNGGRPYEMYVREGRRLDARAMITEHDAKLAAGTMRAPVRSDSVAVTEWYLDSHPCTWEEGPGGMHEGKFMLWAETWPGQVPYRSLLPKGVDNLLVPVCFGATHVAWGGARLEPVFMQTGEAAGLAVALAQSAGVTPAALDSDLLVRELSRRGSLVTFFNDVDTAGKEPWVPAALYFGTKGFFADYDARPDEPLSDAVKARWQEGFRHLQEGTLDPQELAVKVHTAEKEKGLPAGETRGAFLSRLFGQLR